MPKIKKLVPFTFLFILYFISMFSTAQESALILSFTENTGTHSFISDRMYALKFTLPISADYDLREVGVNIDVSSGPGDVKLAIYDSSNDLLYQTAELAVAGGVSEYISAAITAGSVTLEKGSSYFIAVLGNPSTGANIAVEASESYTNLGVGTNVSTASLAISSGNVYPTFPEPRAQDIAWYRSVSLVVKGDAVLEEPTITFFTPTEAGEDETVVIIGTNFTGVTQVAFDGTDATSYTVDSATQITATVGNGSSGDITITTSGGTATASNFNYDNDLDNNGMIDGAFVTTWKTDNPGSSNATSITIPTNGTGYSYDVDWDGDGTFDTFGITGNTTHDYGTAGIYTVQIQGSFPRIAFDRFNDAPKLLTVAQWGTNPWQSMWGAFMACSNLTITASDAPNLTNVETMNRMFRGATAFNSPIGHWDVSNVTDMSGLFREALSFNQDIAAWNTSAVTDMSYMFSRASAFNQNIGGWTTTLVTNMEGMFSQASAFDQNIGDWDVSAVENMGSMFTLAEAFNQDIGRWNVGAVKYMDNMFISANTFNQDIGNWNVSAVETMERTFDRAAAFNQDIGRWNTAAVTNMNGMFRETSAFNQDIGNWDVSAVEDMGFMFVLAEAFNQDIGRWNVGAVQNMRSMFGSTTVFNQDIGAWDVTNVTTMQAMFAENPVFNQDLGAWDTGAVTNMNFMFGRAASFDQNLAAWNVENVVDAGQMFEFSALSGANYDDLLIGWSALTLEENVNFSGGSATYCEAAEQRQSIIDDFGWTIVDSGLICEVNPDNFDDNAFVTTWKTDNPGSSNSTSITIPTAASDGWSYNYDVDWHGDGVFDEFGLTGDATHDYGTAGIYTVQIRGAFPRIVFNNQGDKDKILTVAQWGTIQWQAMQDAFHGCANLNVTATDAPDLSAALSMTNMFRGATAFNADIDHWDVSNIEIMFGTFADATDFNSPIGSWDVSNVTTMQEMFERATSFNQDLGSWVVSSVTNMGQMFNGVAAFNSPIGNWDVSSVENMEFLFYEASAFNQDINGWDVSKVTNMEGMFSYAAAFDQPLDSWVVSSVTDMSSMFEGAAAFNQDIGGWDISAALEIHDMFKETDTFNQDLNGWDVSSVVSLSDVFNDAIAFNQPLNNWDVSAATIMGGMFEGATVFNQPLNLWDVSSVQDMDSMFEGAEAFNQDISMWDVSAVTNMAELFEDAISFNQPLNDWDVSNVQFMEDVFEYATSFNQPLHKWDVGAVEDMGDMFLGATAFNQDISSWDVSSVTLMEQMFSEATAFNQDISGWDVSEVTDMAEMFYGATLFNQNLGSWDVSYVEDMDDMLADAGLSSSNYDALLQGWSLLTLRDEVSFSVGTTGYCIVGTERQAIIDTFNWTIGDAGLQCDPMLPVFTSPKGGFNIASAVYTTAFDIASQTTNNGAIAFNNDGSLLFVSDNSSGTISSYTLTEPYAIATAQYQNQVTGLPDGISGMKFNNDGTKLMYSGSFDREVTELSLSTPYDIATATVAQRVGFEYSYMDLAFNTAGTKMFLISYNSYILYEYDLSTAFDIATAVYTERSFNITEGDFIFGISFNADGSQLFAIAEDGAVLAYALDTPYDLSTMSFTASVFDVNPREASVNAFVFNPNGSKFFSIGTTNFVREYGMDTPQLKFDENSTAPVTNIDANDGLGGASDADVTYALAVGGDNDLFTINTATGALNFKEVPDFETPLDVNEDNDYELTITATNDAGTSQMALLITVTFVDESAPAGYTVAFDQNPITIANSSEASFTSTGGEIGATYSYEITSSGDNNTNKITGSGVIETESQTFYIPIASLENGILTVSLVLTDSSDNAGENAIATTTKNVLNIPQFINPPLTSLLQAFLDAANDAEPTMVTLEENSAYGFTFSANGEKLFIAEINENEITEYNLAAPFDITSATSNFTLSLEDYSVTEENISASDIVFDPTGTIMYVVGPNADYGYAFDLGTPYDLSTVTQTTQFDYDGIFPQVSSISFNNNGTVMYVGTGTFGGANTIIAYDLETPFSANTATFKQEILVPDGFGVLDVTFNKNGLKLYVLSTDFSTSTKLLEYDLEVAFDIGSATLSAAEVDMLRAEEGFITDVNFNEDGSMAYFLGFDQSNGLMVGIPIIRELSYDENGTLPVVNVDANDGDGGTVDENLTYAMGDGADNALFAINPTTGALSFLSSPDYENPLDEDTNNLYEITVVATDGQGSTFLPIVVAISDIENEPPSGYAVRIDQEIIDITNEEAISFTFSDAEIGATYTYVFSSDGGETEVSGTGLVDTTTDQVVSIDLASLEDGISTLAFNLTGANGLKGVEATATITKDTDGDNDGVKDDIDQCLDTPTGETVSTSGCSDSQIDTDDDGVFDNEDNCVETSNNDQLDTDLDGEGNVCDTNDDNDGVLDTDDAFPLDETEDTDTDEDGTGDNADTDDDNDGDTDEEEITNGTDPLNPMSFFEAEEEVSPAVVSLIPAEAFTPNGDGINDTWVVPGIDNYPNNVVKVYNRWGHEVFTAGNYQNNWEGNQNGNGTLLPAGSYYYIVELGNGSAPLQGWIFINY